MLSIDRFSKNNPKLIISYNNIIAVMDGGFSFEKEIEFWKQVKIEVNAL